MNNKPLTTFEIAEYCQVTHRTVQQWIQTGKLKAYRTPGNHSRVEARDFEGFLRKFNLPIPEDFLLTSGKRRILIVDDDKTMVRIIREYIKDIKYLDIEEAYDGFMAGKKFVEFKPDLITLDIKMPFLNGIEVLKEIRSNAKHDHVKIMIISGTNDDSEINRIKKLGADEFLTKPIDQKMLSLAVENLLRIKK